MSFRSSALLVACLLLFGGCSVSERIVNEDREGEIPKAVFKSFKVNKSTMESVMRVLGEPEDSERVSEEVTTFTYQYTRAHYKSATNLIVFKSTQVERHREYLHLVFRDGVLKKKWQDTINAIAPYKIAKIVDPPKSVWEKLWGSDKDKKSNVVAPQPVPTPAEKRSKKGFWNWLWGGSKHDQPATPQQLPEQEKPQMLDKPQMLNKPDAAMMDKEKSAVMSEQEKARMLEKEKIMRERERINNQSSSSSENILEPGSLSGPNAL